MDFHPHEIRVLKALTQDMPPNEVADACGLPVDAVLSAVSWLKTKNLVEVEEKISEELSMGEEGMRYMSNGAPFHHRLPEYVYLDIINAISPPIIGPDRKEGVKLDSLKERKVFDSKYHEIAIHWLIKKKKEMKIDFSRGMIFKTSNEKINTGLDQELVRKISEQNVVSTKDLSPEEREMLAVLKKRGDVLRIKEVKAITLKPTKKSKELAETLEVDESASQLTPEMIVSGGWRKQSFRPYDVSVYTKPEYPVKKHPLAREIDQIRDIFVRMGFTEISGPLVESAFWNFDALFQPQDHPAREMHDTFYLSHPKKIDIPGFDKYKNAVKKTHEDGGDTGSTGWQYKWNEETAKKVLLRTHTTAVTCRYLSTLKKGDLPAKVFSVGSVFRNEALDYKHLPEFYQVEGIVVDPNVTFRNLLGILERFYTEMNLKVRFRPGYFPYTEMSVEPEVYFEEKGEWIEMGGAGIFRSEVVKPILGFDCPVLAWGLGVDRVVAMKLGFSDIRTPYLNDLNWLKRN